MPFDEAACRRRAGARMMSKSGFNRSLPKPEQGRSISKSLIPMLKQSGLFSGLSYLGNALGCVSLNEWHQPVSIHGAGVNNRRFNPFGYLKAGTTTESTTIARWR